MDAIDHELPLNFSTMPSMYSPAPKPAAIQSVGLVHDTPFNELFASPTSFVLTFTQAFPFHISPNVRLTPEELSKLPTAMQKLELVHDTAFKASMVPLFSVGWSDHVDGAAEAAPIWDATPNNVAMKAMPKVRAARFV